jgi:hypothetical protein
VDKHGSISFAGSGYRVGNKFIGTTVGVRVVSGTIQITLDDALLRTHRARYDRLKEFGALAPTQRQAEEGADVRHVYRSHLEYWW